MVYSYNATGGADAGRARGVAYFAMWIVAFKITGAHFNPATSLAVFICERRMSNLVGFFLTFLAQLIGAYLGIGLSYLLIKDYLGNYSLIPSSSPIDLYIGLTDVYWARPILQETLQTFTFTLAYLVLVYEPSLQKVDRILKGLCSSIVLNVCLLMTQGSGGSLNPAFGLAQSTYMVALLNRDGSTAGSDAAKYMWVYIIFPFVGALFAALLYRYHQSMDPLYVPPV